MNKSVTFVLVEDDSLDVESFERTLRRHEIECPLLVANNGAEALELVRSQEFVETSNGSYIVFLDINMPIKNGHEFLEEIRSDEDLRNAIVFVLTTSTHERDLKLAYEKNVAGYFSKSNMGKLMETIKNYVAGAEFPPHGS